MPMPMPKRTLTQLPKEQIAPPIPKPSASAVEKQMDQKLKSPSKPIAQPKSQVATTVPKPISEPKPPMATAPQIPKEKTEGKEVEALPPSKQQEEIQRKVSPIAKQTGEEKAGGSMATTPEIVEKKGETTDGLKDLVKEKDKDSMAEAADISKAKEKASEKAVAVEKKPKEGGGGFLEMKGTGMDRIMKRVKRLGTEDAEDRQLLVNIGVSVLVIVALGAYITYSYRSSHLISSGKPKS
ncbi:hypothetical protein V6N13_092892 [Hibiscus sabdariffa]